MAIKTAEMSIIFKTWVNKKEALKILDKFGLLQYERKRTDGRKNSLITFSVFVPSLRIEELIKRLNVEEKEVVRARKIPSK